MLLQVKVNYVSTTIYHHHILKSQMSYYYYSVSSALKNFSHFVNLSSLVFEVSSNRAKSLFVFNTHHLLRKEQTCKLNLNVPYVKKGHRPKSTLDDPLYARCVRVAPFVPNCLTINCNFRVRVCVNRKILDLILLLLN